MRHNVNMNAQMGIRIPVEQRAKLDAIALEQRNTASGIIRLAIDHFTESYRRRKEELVQQPELIDLFAQDEPERRAAEGEHE